MGHEASGVVKETGPGVTAFTPGDHVVFSFVPICGQCGPCMSGRAVLCENGAKANAEGRLLSGAKRFRGAKNAELNHHLGVSAFSQYTVAAQESLVKIDKSLPLEKASLFGCAVMTGVGAALNTADIRPGDSAVVFGLGGVGLSAVLGAKVAGATPLIAVDVLDAKLQLAESLGATHTINALKEDPVAAVRDITGGGADYAFESVGNEKVLIQAYQATGRGATTVTIGLPHPSKQFTIPAVSLVAEERTVKGSYMGSAVPRRDIPRYIALYQDGKLPVDKLLSDSIKLEDINAAFDRLDKGEAVRQVIGFKN
jgi:alcohol dehydrogenase